MYSFDYEGIKKLAAETGKRVEELLALARQNDPFYAGTPTDWEQANWFADLWQQAGYTNGVHLRRAHYYGVSRSPLMPNGLPYENTDKCWKFLTQASKMARYLGLVQIADVVDRKNPDPHVNALYSNEFGNPRFYVFPPEIQRPYINVYGFDGHDAQPYHTEVWCEKSTMNDVLGPICQEHRANLCTFEGEVSISAVHSLIERIKAGNHKPTRIFYISDFDPAGNSMPVATSRKLEWMIYQDQWSYEFDVRLRPIALTAEQVREYDLPRTPIKETERRAAKFEENFGTGAVELDALEALHPGTLARMVRDVLRPYYDLDIVRANNRLARDFQSAVREKVDAVVAPYQAHIDALANLKTELEAITMDDTSDFEAQPSTMWVPEDEEWLFDSNRDYEDQITYYKAHKAGTNGDE